MVQAADAQNGHHMLRRQKVNAVLMRAGTVRFQKHIPTPCLIKAAQSKGLFFKASDLPSDKAKWNDAMLGSMGSPDPVN